MTAPLLGHNLVRLVYLDEAGISKHESALAVAGVLVHGDNQSGEIEDRIAALVERYIPPADRLGFVFHAKDIYHGSGYFDREVWPRELRNQILFELADIIQSLHLPVVAGVYRKDDFATNVTAIGAGILAGGLPGFGLDDTMHTFAALDCVMRADGWMGLYAPDERAMVIAEDTNRIKHLMKESVRVLRSAELMDHSEFPASTRIRFDLPLKRIIDTVHFASKSDSKLLQLADLCAFIWGRVMKQKPVPQDVYDIIFFHTQWVSKLNRATDERMAATSSQPSS